MTTIPPLPTYPGPDAPEAAQVQYRVDMEAFRAAVDQAHAEAQAMTAAAMQLGAVAQQATAAAQQALADSWAHPQPPSRPRRLQAAIDIAGRMASRAGSLTQVAPTPAKLAADAKATVDALATLYPDGFED